MKYLGENITQHHGTLLAIYTVKPVTGNYKKNKEMMYSWNLFV